MSLVLALLAFALALGLSVKRIGFGVYAGLFAFALVSSLVFLALWKPSL